MSLSVPANSRVNGERTIVFSRPIEDRQGHFVGIVFASVNTRYFEDIYEAIESVHSRLFTLLNTDGIILFRYPEDLKSPTGRPLSGKAIWLDAVSKGGTILPHSRSSGRRVTLRLDAKSSTLSDDR